MTIIATDLDGTLYKGHTLIDGVKKGLLKIINEGIEIYYTTNNSSQSPNEIKDKLDDLAKSQGYVSSKEYDALESLAARLEERITKLENQLKK